MKLLTDELIQLIPALYGSERVPNSEKVAYARLFHPILGWNWYVLEYDGYDECFGLVVGCETELGYFRLSELSAVMSSKLAVERDMYFRPTKLIELVVPSIRQIV